MAENKLDAKTRKIVQANRPDVGKEGAAYQSAEKQLLAISAEQQRNLELAKLSAKSDAQRNDILQQAATVAVEESTAASGGMEAVTQQVNPVTQAVLSKYGMGQPKFRKSQTTSQQVTKQNIVINNNTTNQTTNNVQVPSNIGGPLQGRPLQFKPGSPSENGGRLKLWLNQTFAKQKEESVRRDRDYEKREISLTKSANKIMRKLEDIGKTMSERLDPRQIGTTVTSQLKALLFLLGIQFVATNWTKILGYIDDIQKKVENFADWMGFGKNSRKGETPGFLKAIKKFFTGKEDGDIGTTLKKIFWNPGTSDKKKMGLLNILMEFIQNLWDDRSEALRQVLKMPTDGLFNSDALKKLGLDKAFQGTLNQLGNIFTAIVSGTRGLSKILGNNIRNNATDRITNVGGSSDDRKLARENYFASAGALLKDHNLYDTKTYLGDANLDRKNITKNFDFDFDREGELKSSSAAGRTGNAIISALKDNKETRTDEVITGFKLIENYLKRHENDKDRSKYIIWSEDKLNTIAEYFGIKKDDKDWIKILDETKNNGRYKYIRRKLTDKEKEYIEDSNNQKGIIESKIKTDGKEYIYEMVPIQDKREGVKNKNGQIIVGRAHGIDIESLNQIRHLIQKYSNYKGKNEGDELTFNLDDKRSIAAIEESIYKVKQEKGTEENRRAYANAGGNPHDYRVKKGEVKRTMDPYLESFDKYEDLVKDAEYAEEKAKREIGESTAAEVTENMAAGVDEITNTIANETGIDAVRTNAKETVQNARKKLTVTPENESWSNPYNQGNGLIALVGDSYAVGMSTYFLDAVEKYGGEARATCSREYHAKDLTKYCVVGATINDACTQVKSAINDGASTIVFYIGTNNYGSEDYVVRGAYERLIEIANTGQAKLYFSTLICSQPRKVRGNTTLGEKLKGINHILETVCSNEKVGILKLDKTSGNYTKWDKEGIHPTGNSYKTMANDLVDLLKGKNVSFVPVSEKPMQSGQSAVGKTGNASGGMEDAITYAMDYFIKQGFSPEAAAGLVGNFMHESGLNTNIKNKYSGAYGIAQWLGDRKDELFNRYGNNPTLKDELDYVMHELETTHTNAVKHLNNSSNPTEAATSAFGYYEFSAGPEKAIEAMNKHKAGNMEGQKSLNLRIANANDAYAIYNKRKNNVVDMSSMTGAPGGSYSPGTYELGSYSSNSGESSLGGVGGSISSFLGGGFLGNLIGELANMATHIWDYIIVPTAKSIGDVVEEKVDEIGEDVKEFIDSDINPEVYTGKITPELKNYEAYKENPGDLPTGLSEVEWKEAVYDKTGNYPIDLGPVDSSQTTKKTEIEETEKTETKANPIEEYQKEKSSKAALSDIGIERITSTFSDIFNYNTDALASKNPEEQQVEYLRRLVELAERRTGQTEKNGGYLAIGARMTATVADNVKQNTQVTATTGLMARGAGGNKAVRYNPSQSGSETNSQNDFSIG